MNDEEQIRQLQAAYAQITDDGDPKAKSDPPVSLRPEKHVQGHAWNSSRSPNVWPALRVLNFRRRQALAGSHFKEVGGG